MKLPFLAAALLSLSLASACTHEDVQLDVDFRKQGNSLIVENRNDFDYKDLDAVVNEKYYYRVASIKAKGSLSIPLSDFATKEGQHFSPQKDKLSSMTLHALTEDEVSGN